MSKFGTSQPVTRLEDTRFLTGRGRYIDDIAPNDALVAYFLRSPVAHAEITALDVTDAKAAPGVVAVYTAADLADRGLKNAMRFTTVKNRDGSSGAAPVRPILAEGRVRFVGEPMVCIIAETLTAAKDAAELVEFDFDDLDAKLTLAPGGAVLHDEAPDNIAYDWALGDEAAVEAALAGSAHRVRLRIEDNRIIASSMEPRGAFAEPDGERLHLAFSGQGVWGMKGDLAQWFSLAPSAIRITNPDVGGGFGMKAMGYPEYYLLALGARDLQRPIRWMSERTEAMLSDNAGRDLVSTAELGFDADFKITAYRVSSISNLGAYNSQFGQAIQSSVSSKVLTGVYDVQCAFVNNRGVYTNTTQVDAYRGAGRPEAIYTLERTMDYAARVLGIAPAELRRRNFVTEAQMPYRTASGELYDTGAFSRLL
ncbi:MAG: molybdopterin cofactor-binding domain-containing protein, partial [Pseudomonadota bacterium]